MIDNQDNPGLFCASIHGIGSVWAVAEHDGTYTVYAEDGAKLKHWTQADAALQHMHRLPNVVAHRFVETWAECDLAVGHHHPRISRGKQSPGRGHYAREWAGSHGAVVSLIRRMNEVFQFIEPNRDNMTAYGHETRHLLILAATEVESAFRAVLAANQYSGPGDQTSRRNTKDFVQLAVPMRLSAWSVSLRNHPDLQPMAPFAGWQESQPTASLDWYDAYNSVKHDRERNFARATLRHAVTAVAAAYILVNAQFGEFDIRHYLGLDEFQLAASPRWALSEQYVPPQVGGQDLGWIPKPWFR